MAPHVKDGFPLLVMFAKINRYKTFSFACDEINLLLVYLIQRQTERPADKHKDRQRSTPIFIFFVN